MDRVGPKGKEMVILGVDPGSWKAGYGLVAASRGSLQHLAHGVIICGSSRIPLPERLGVLYRELTRVMETFRPDVMALEGLFHSKNPHSSLILGHARGVILLAALHGGVEVHEYSPLMVKQALTGYGLARKEQVRYMVKALLGLAQVLPVDASDALAAAICHAHSWSGPRPRAECP